PAPADAAPVSGSAADAANTSASAPSAPEPAPPIAAAADASADSDDTSTDAALAAANTANSAVIVPPKQLEVPAPRYPPQAMRLRKEATVLLKVYVDERGQVRQVEPLSRREIGFGFDAAAIRAAQEATFRPATRDGEPFAMWTTLTMRFRLSNR
ncbi:MAG: TonB family protein, partial [Acidobacteriota bacterium]